MKVIYQGETWDSSLTEAQLRKTLFVDGAKVEISQVNLTPSGIRYVTRKTVLVSALFATRSLKR